MRGGREQEKGEESEKERTSEGEGGELGIEPGELMELIIHRTVDFGVGLLFNRDPEEKEIREEEEEHSKIEVGELDMAIIDSGSGEEQREKQEAEEGGL